MRIKDELKQEAIINATVKLVNEIGFSATSVSKIAKEANVSPATIYIYYKNKEDLLISTYVDIKMYLGKSVTEGLNLELPIRDILLHIWRKIFKFVKENPEIIKYKEQFANSPYEEMIDHSSMEKAFHPVIEVIQRGIDQKIIKDVEMDILATYVFYPIFILTNKKMCKNLVIDDELIDKTFNLSWDAIKL